MKKIFLVEDDKNFGAVLQSYLEINDYYVKWVNDGAFAVKEYKQDTYDICILDVMLPNVDGFTIGKEIKEINSSIPIIFLTAKTMKADVLEGYQIGADDYITKPFDSEVLLYKIKVILKRNSVVEELPDNQEFTFGKTEFSYLKREVVYKGSVQKLTPKEAELLKLLCLHKNTVLSRSKALSEIWGDDNYFTGRSMDVFITKLRKYLQKDESIEIINVHGSGYRLVENTA